MGTEIFQEATVRSQADIKRILYALDPSRNVSTEVQLVTEMTAEDEKGQMRRYRVRATSPSQTRRDVLLEAFRILKSRQDAQEKSEREVKPTLVNGRPMRSAFKNALDSYMWIDPLLKRWLGATRQGLSICWEIDGCIYSYCIFEHKLTKRTVSVK